MLHFTAQSEFPRLATPALEKLMLQYRKNLTPENLYPIVRTVVQSQCTSAELVKLRTLVSICQLPRLGKHDRYHTIFTSLCTLTMSESQFATFPCQVGTFLLQERIRLEKAQAWTDLRTAANQ